MLGCVILNYNDYITTLSLLNTICNYTIFDIIVIVDGNSTDNSYTYLKNYEMRNIKVIKAKKNGGYGYGNNIGIRYCMERGMDYVLIANPDVIFAEDAIIATQNFLIDHDECVAAAPRMANRPLGMKILSPAAEIANSFIVINTIIKPRSYSNKEIQDKNYLYVGAIPGSLVMYNLRKLFKAGLYDENIFLYYEELIMSVKFQRYRYKSAILLNYQYIHNHSVTVSKAFKNPALSKKIEMRSKKIYLKQYRNVSPIEMALFYISYPFVISESYIWGRLKWLKDRISI